MLWLAFMFEAGDVLRLGKTSSFCNMEQGKSPSSLLQSINRGHILLERQGRWAAGVTLASLGVAPAITHVYPAANPLHP